MIQYKYSLTEKNEIVEISQLTVDERTRKYYCLGCGNQLIAKMGAIKEWHFAHKVQVNCSSETYLHRLGKEIFEREYRNCLTNNEPFVLEVPRDIECNKCIDDFNVRCTGSTVIEELDLTKHFDVLEIEKTDNGFRPDIMLINSKSGRRIYVEIAVTHRVEQEKIDLGEVIVEYSIYAEQDLQIIKKRRITSSNPNIKLFNFVPKTYAYEDLSKTKFCSEYRSYFLVFRSGKSIVIDIPLPEVKNRLLSSPCIYSKIVKSSEIQ